MRTKLLAVAAAVTAAAASVLVAGTAGASSAGGGTTASDNVRYLVLTADGASRADALAALARLGGTVVAENAAIHAFTVQAPTSGFAGAVAREPALAGAAPDRVIGELPTGQPEKIDVNAEPAAARAARAAQARATGASSAQSVPLATADEPLSGLQWDMRMIKADQANRANLGDRRVKVGIIDSGIDITSPDLAGNVDVGLSRNFVTDMPDIDGPCEFAGCVDPVGHDDSGHGTHVAGTVAAAVNGVGIAGVAPNVTLVQVRAGQDSGYLFLGPVVNAITYAGDAGLDVVNMSFYVDPWLFNCTANPADSPQAQLEQHAILAAMSRAMEYAHSKNVTMVVSLGNQHLDMANPGVDASSPDYPVGAAYSRTVSDDCLSLPIEGPHTVGVSALGPSERKADYSNWGQHITVAAPGGWFRDGLGTPSYRTDANLVLSTYPKNVLQAQGSVDQDGNIVAGFENSVFKSCTADGQCGYYAYLQGTSMASPHAAGAAALIVSAFGHLDPSDKAGLTLRPDRVEQVLTDTAAEHACPASGVEDYTVVGRPASWTATCVGTPEFNGFYGYGIVDAYAAVTYTDDVQ